MGVVYFPGVTEDTTIADLPADNILNGALEKGLSECFLIGTDMEGEPYIASTTGDMKRILYLMKRFEHGLFNGDYE